ncbi:immunoglobulin-like domain-containing protein [Anaerorhabdus sp.]|uniref:immunoglobulin-like domain-containing protein n=1 Tax=Anaerorhabdus sp. TaxID=1872524 RepID=UPI002FC99D44
MKKIVLITISFLMLISTSIANVFAEDTNSLVETPTWTVTYTSSEGGKVEGTTEEVVNDEGTPLANVTLITNESYVFNHWTDEEGNVYLNNEALKEKVILKDEIFTAQFMIESVIEDTVDHENVESDKVVEELIVNDLVKANPLEIFIDNQNGLDTGDGSFDNPVQTLAKAFELVQNDGIIILKGDVLLESCIRLTDKKITIKSEEGNKYTITRGDNFAALSDNNRSWYNPAMFEIAGTGNVGIKFENIILDDANKSKGTEYKKQGFGNLGQDTTKNLQIVHDAIIAMYNPQAEVVMVNTDLLNFAGLNAIKHGAGILDYQSGLISGGANKAESIALVSMSDAGATIGAGVTITDLHGGIGVYVSKQMEFGGQILNTTLSNALQLENGAQVQLTSTSKISGNTSTFAGVIYVRGKNAILTIDGEVSDNKTLEDNAGALYIYESKVFIESNALITRNESTDPSTLSFQGKLQGKTAGAGIFATEGALITMNGGIISENRSIGGSTLLGNSSGYNGGGGIAVVRNATFIMNDGKIINNSSNSYGGGIMLHVDRNNYSKGSIVLNGGEISGNTAPKSNLGNDVFISGFGLNQYFATEAGNYITVNDSVVVGDGIANGKTQIYANELISIGQLKQSAVTDLKNFATAQGYDSFDSVWINSDAVNSKIAFGMKKPQYDSSLNDLYVIYIPVDKLTGEVMGSDFKVQRQKNVVGDIVNVSIDLNARLAGNTYGVLLVKGPRDAAPAINASDKVITIGDNFNPLSNVSATDAEDGEIVLTLANVIFNNVDTSKLGTYQVTYSVTDSAGTMTEKTINITVKDKNIVNPVLPESGRTCQDDGYPEGYYWNGIGCIAPSGYKVPNTGV